MLDSLVQKLNRPNAATWVGAGKVAEAAELAQELDVDFIIADNDLSPAQERNIEKITEKTVIDRSQLPKHSGIRSRFSFCNACTNTF